ncbi:hypothetical protein BGZ98_009568 [Dissophora globulifera]|nr:hypothetical protein BGZ98_009568 [Dissophora globulifera]
MKFTLSVAVLALAASQAMAVVPIPVKECTKSVVVMPTDVLGCDDFATRHGTTFANMLLWNTKLSPKCDNLDVGHPMCVSITPGDCCLEKPLETIPPLLTPGATVTGTSAAPVATSTGAVTTNAPRVTTTAPAAGPSVTVTPTTIKQNDAASTKSSMMLAAAGVVLSVAYML